PLRPLISPKDPAMSGAIGARGRRAWGAVRLSLAVAALAAALGLAAGLWALPRQRPAPAEPSPPATAPPASASAPAPAEEPTRPPTIWEEQLRASLLATSREVGVSEADRQELTTAGDRHREAVARLLAARGELKGLPLLAAGACASTREQARLLAEV